MFKNRDTSMDPRGAEFHHVQMIGVHDLWIVEFRNYGKWEVYSIARDQDGARLHVDALQTEKAGVVFRVVHYSALACYNDSGVLPKG